MFKKTADKDTGCVLQDYDVENNREVKQPADRKSGCFIIVLG